MVKKISALLSIVLIMGLLSQPVSGSAPDTLLEKGISRSGFYSLAFPGEVYVITAEQLKNYNINTFQDILDLLPGVDSWREGPPASPSGCSVDGTGGGGITLYLNGHPFCNIQTSEPLSGFLPLSRLTRVEVIYSGTPMLTGDASGSGAINVVTEEGGREAPFSEMDFTYGRSNRRARRIWFSTPRSYISGTIAYDAYLQDAFVPTSGIGRIGKYHSKSVLADLSLTGEEGESIMFRLQRYEDVYEGTYYSGSEEVRRDGFSSRLYYRRDNLSIGIFQDELNRKDSSGELAGLKTAARASYRSRAGEILLRGYLRVDHNSLESSLKKIYTDTTYTIINGETLYVNVDKKKRKVPREPEDIYKIEGGVVAGGDIREGLRWRAGLFGGDHSETGRYWEGEGGVVKIHQSGLKYSAMVSHRTRLPSPVELFYPVADSTFTGDYITTGGNRSLDPETSLELALGVEYRSGVSFHLLARRKSSAITGREDFPVMVNRGESFNIVGLRGRLSRDGKLWRFQWGWKGHFQIFPHGWEEVYGITRYRIGSDFFISTEVFKQTEVLRLRWSAGLTGRRNWYDNDPGSCMVHDVGLSMTILGAVIRGEYKNVLDEEYETVPGFSMPGRYWMMGIYWEFFD